MLTMEKTMVDEYIKPDSVNINQEKAIYNAVYKKVMVKNNKSFFDMKNKTISIEYLENLINETFNNLFEDSRSIANRIYIKLLIINNVQHDYFAYIFSIIASFAVYFIPNLTLFMARYLLEDKKDWEVLNSIYIFTIFGKMPPYSIKSIMPNILLASNIYRHLFIRLVDGLNNGRGADIFDEVLIETDNGELFEMLETMKMTLSTGLLNSIDSFEEIAENQLKWLEIKSIKRRKSKQLFAMLPVVIIIFFAFIYFSFGLSILSNPINLIK